ncbi:MAG: hypothetical protein H6606_03415 [Flavobacteriales bacterium]|nr:hypothetical protein [Flavobacteriales bacterium]
MSPNQLKLEQIRLQHKIAEVLRKDNGVTCHFDYHVNLMSSEETVKLNLLTYNERHDEYMLFHTTKGNSSIDCLTRMWDYIHLSHPKSREDSYTVSWRKHEDQDIRTSYFRATSSEDAIRKFFHEKSEEDYKVLSVVLNPVA